MKEKVYFLQRIFGVREALILWLLETLRFFVWQGASFFAQGPGFFVLPLCKKSKYRIQAA